MGNVTFGGKSASDQGRSGIGVHGLALVPRARAGARKFEVVSHRPPSSDGGARRQGFCNDLGHRGPADVAGTDENDPIGQSVACWREIDDRKARLGHSAYSSRSVFLTIFPVPARGHSVLISSCSGIFCIMSPASLQKATISSRLSSLAGSS